MQLLTAPHLSAPHGFSTRLGGVSEPPFDSLNLGLSTGDEPRRVAENRRRFLAHFGVAQSEVCALSQVHGKTVIEARAGWFKLEADGAVTDQPERLVVVSAADCLAVLVHDPRHNAVGAAHAGWRGTVAKIVVELVGQLGARYGSQPEELRVAIGPGIGRCCYQVGPEVIAQVAAAGISERVYGRDTTGYHLDLAAANRELLLGLGVPAAQLWTSGYCTHCNPELFFSHRREAGRTGRMWAAIRPRPL